MTLHFEHGLAAGDGSFGNEMLLARDGRGRLVLRGTSLAGVLRGAWEKSCSEKSGSDVEARFGSSAENGSPSPLVVPDVEIKTNGVDAIRRTHHQRCRHTGSVLEHGLYSIEYAPPKSTAEITLWFHDRDGDGEEFLKELAVLFRRGLILGGNSNRGVGLAQGRDFRCTVYDLTDRNDYAAYLDDHYAWRETGQISGKSFDAESRTPTNDLVVRFALSIPRGQDLLIAQGSSEDTDAEPHRIRAADGKDYWLLPGSTLHGLFRNWCSRLAARENPDNPEIVADSVRKFEHDKKQSGSDLGWLFDENEKNNEVYWNKLREKHPVDALFGSLHGAGRVHFSDALCPVSESGKLSSTLSLDDRSEVRQRMHVAIDAFSGGAIEHLLFDNLVLISSATDQTTGTAKQLVFHCTLIVKDVREKESCWIAKTLRALDLGLLRIGSAKSSGRLALVATPTATGPFSTQFTELQPSRR